MLAMVTVVMDMAAMAATVVVVMKAMMATMAMMSVAAVVGDDVFGGPRWGDLVGAARAQAYQATQTIPLMVDAQGQPIKRNFVHVEDLVSAILVAIDHPKARQQLFNICMDEPLDYRELAAYLYATRQLPSVEIPTPYHATWLDNTKAKFLLNWRPQYDLRRMVESAWSYQRANDDPRVIWYPG